MLRRLLFHNFRVVYAASRWLRRRFTIAGRVVLATLLVAGALGIDTHQSALYQAFGLLAGLLLVSLLTGTWFPARFSIQRDLPRFATVGEALSYRVRVRNRSRRTQRGLFLMDLLAEVTPSAAQLSVVRLPGEERLNWFDRMVGYPRWAWYMGIRRGADLPERPVPATAPLGASSVMVQTVPRRRGFLRFAGAYVARPDLLGLYKGLAYAPRAERLLVLPRRYTLPEVTLPGARRYQRGGVALSSRVGDSGEITSVRDYRPGDPLRHIHWRSWARVGRPMVKTFQDEYFPRQALILDTFAAVGEDRVFEEAVSVAASFACSVPTRDTLLDLVFVGHQAHAVTAGRGVSGSDHLLEVLACVEPCRDHSFSSLSRLVAAHAASLSGCVCVFLAWDEGRRALVEALLGQGIPVLALVVAAESRRLDPGPMAATPERLHLLVTGRIQEGLTQLCDPPAYS